MSRGKLLLVDDEKDFVEELKRFLENAGYNVATAPDGETALAAMGTYLPDLVILDIIMPRMNGHRLLNDLRETGDWTPVILLTKVERREDRYLGFSSGADDFVDKSTDPWELLLRIEAVLRRSQRGATAAGNVRSLICEELVLDRRSRQVALDREPISLTPRALRLLEYLMLHPEQVHSRKVLLERVWGYAPNFAEDVSTRAVDIRIAEIRKALNDSPASPRFIEAVVGQGYRFLGVVHDETTG